ncbi:hypothetical protein IU501_01115 [Nocardia otitidiscaviarum]|uniref:hypothetical protein n=1 Tax=Nocardia otitidiscaviarum TaxID=1823 RepID=UPI00189579F5|nr:hypothetical protein [Nocardia otitidiscaviarum]MBF6131605.1 hypothetical protein [Nocardia otitidiscaviarum]
MAADDDVADGVKLAAIRDALDRAGVSAKTAVEIEVGPNKPFQEMLDTIMFGGTRAESRAARGIPDEPLDAEVVAELQQPRSDDPEPSAPRPTHPKIVSLDEAHPEPGNGLVSMEDAMAELNRTAPRPRNGKRKR